MNHKWCSTRDASWLPNHTAGLRFLRFLSLHLSSEVSQSAQPWLWCVCVVLLSQVDFHVLSFDLHFEPLFDCVARDVPVLRFLGRVRFRHLSNHRFLRLAGVQFDIWRPTFFSTLSMRFVAPRVPPTRVGARLRLSTFFRLRRCVLLFKKKKKPWFRSNVGHRCGVTSVVSASVSLLIFSQKGKFRIVLVLFDSFSWNLYCFAICDSVASMLPLRRRFWSTYHCCVCHSRMLAFACKRRFTLSAKGAHTGDVASHLSRMWFAFTHSTTCTQVVTDPHTPTRSHTYHVLTFRKSEWQLWRGRVDVGHVQVWIPPVHRIEDEGWRALSKRMSIGDTTTHEPVPMDIGSVDHLTWYLKESGRGISFESI